MRRFLGCFMFSRFDHIQLLEDAGANSVPPRAVSNRCCSIGCMLIEGGFLPESDALLDDCGERIMFYGGHRHLDRGGHG